MLPTLGLSNPCLGRVAKVVMLQHQFWPSDENVTALLARSYCNSGRQTTAALCTGFRSFLVYFLKPVKALQHIRSSDLHPHSSSRNRRQFSLYPTPIRQSD